MKKSCKCSCHTEDSNRWSECRCDEIVTPLSPMTNPLAEQVAGLKVGEWVEARFEAEGKREVLYAEVKDADGIIYLDSIQGRTLRYLTGEIHPFLTSINRVPRPIPSEPEVGSFALTANCPSSGGRFQVYENGDGEKWRSWHDSLTWPEIYPNITHLYTPSGDLVEGFEYYKAGDA